MLPCVSIIVKFSRLSMPRKGWYFRVGGGSRWKGSCGKGDVGVPVFN